MPPTIRDLLRIDGLGLVARSEGRSVDHPISWVHVSDLADPTPYLNGGELLLTAGRFPDGELPSYVDRLVAADVVGLGYGLESRHDEVPTAMVERARSARLPLFEVPADTPFIAIGQVAATAVAADGDVVLRQTHKSQRELIRAATARDASAAMVRLLHGKLDAWALILDSAGALVAGEPPSAARWVAGLEGVLDRLRTARTPASSAFSFGDDEVIAHSLGNSTVRGFLAVGRGSSFDASERQLLSTAVALLTMRLEEALTHEAADRQLRTGVLHLLRIGQLNTSRAIARELSDGLPREPYRLFALAGPSTAQAAAVELVKSEMTRLREHVFYAESGDVTVVMVRDGRPFALWLLELPHRVDGLHLGLSDASDYRHFASAHRQAVQAAEVGVHEQTPVTRFTEVRERGLAQFMDAGRAQAFAVAALDPLVRHDQHGRGELVDSLRVWLEQHGQWGPAAARLGIHRHTLRHRIKKAEKLLHRPLDSPTSRAELWLALQAYDESEH